MFKTLKTHFQDFLERPRRVFLITISVVIGALLFDGTLIRLFKLYSDEKLMKERVVELRELASTLKGQIRQARQLEYVEREARDRFDLAEEDDLVFVFTNDETGFDLDRTLSRSAN